MPRQVWASRFSKTRFPAMPDLEKPTRAILVTSSTGISHRHLKRMAEQLSCSRRREPDSDS